MVKKGKEKRTINYVCEEEYKTSTIKPFYFQYGCEFGIRSKDYFFIFNGQPVRRGRNLVLFQSFF